MRTATRRDIVAAAARRAGVASAVAGEVFDAILAEVKARYRAGQRVELRGFGSFEPRRRAPRAYRSVDGGEMTAEGKTILRFRPSKQLEIHDREAGEA